jgi:hypothetical protein
VWFGASGLMAQSKILKNLYFLIPWLLNNLSISGGYVYLFLPALSSKIPLKVRFIKALTLDKATDVGEHLSTRPV